MYRARFSLRGVGSTRRSPWPVPHPLGFFAPFQGGSPVSWSAENIEPRMTPLHEDVNQVFRDFVFRKKHLEDLMTENLFQVFQFEQRRHTEHAVSMKITKGVYCHNRSDIF